MTFEQAIARINEITVMMSSGVTVEESVELYREAAGLLVLCRDILAKAKLEVEKVTVTFDDGN